MVESKTKKERKGKEEEEIKLRKKVKKGDIIILQYDAYIADSMELFDTTHPDKAKNKSEETDNIGPITIVVGEKQVIEGLDDALINSKVGEPKRIEISKEKAFGLKNPKYIKTLPLSQFKKQKINPYPGLIITYENGMQGKVLAVNAGRVRMDFNHPLAGKDLVYDFVVEKIILEPKERTKALLDMLSKNLVKEDEIIVKKEDNKQIIEITNDKLKNSEKIIEEYLKKYMKDISKVVVKGKEDKDKNQNNDEKDSKNKNKNKE